MARACPTAAAAQAAETSREFEEFRKREAELAQAAVQEKVFALKSQYDKSVGQKKALEDEATNLQLKLDTAVKLIDGLSGEKERWVLSIARFEKALIATIGDCLAAAAFMSYAGPFPADYRQHLVTDTWIAGVRSNSIPASADFAITSFLSKPTDVRFWNIQGLPSDDFSTENGVLVVRGERWPLMIDPQRQARGAEPPACPLTLHIKQ